jgi:hypothetical protein
MNNRIKLIMYGKNFGTLIDSPYFMDGDYGLAVFYKVKPSSQLERLFPQVEKLKTKLVDIAFKHEIGDVLIAHSTSGKFVVKTTIYDILANMKD